MIQSRAPFVSQIVNRQSEIVNSAPAFVLGRPPAAKPGLLFYILCDSVAATLDAILAHQGEILQPIGADAPEITARFRDPAGNIIGLYQEPK